MPELEELIDCLYELHAEPDRRWRRRGLQGIVAEDVEFYGLQVQVIGLDEFADIFHTAVEHGRLVRTTAVEEHSGWLRNGWEMQLPTGEPATSAEGETYGGSQISQLSPDGRLWRLIPFLGMSPPEDRASGSRSVTTRRRVRLS